MKVLIAGSGGQGSSAAGQLAKEKDVEQIICADVDLARAERLASRLKDLRKGVQIGTARVDFNNSEDLAHAAKGVDVVFNACFPSVNVPILKACITVGAHYVDVASFPFESTVIPRDQTMNGLLDFNDRAKSAGITAISNMGVAPGFTDITTHYIANQLDTVDRVMLRWFDKLDATELIATWWAAGIIGEWFDPPHPIAWEKGKIIEIDLLKGAEEYEFPEPVGKGTIYTATFHPELFTISQFMPQVTGKSVNYIELKGGHQIGDWSMKDVWIEIIRRAVVKTPVVNKVGTNLVELFAKEFIQPGDFKEACDRGLVKDGVVTGAIELTGTKSGKKIRHTVTGIVTLKEAQKHIPWSSPMSYIVGMTAALAVLALGRGQVKQNGVGCAWWIEKPEEFLEECKNRGVVATERIEKY
jgi:saccharopine dehydrogenase-like NADP-dependent oxidoreductase